MVTKRFIAAHLMTLIHTHLQLGEKIKRSGEFRELCAISHDQIMFKSNIKIIFFGYMVEKSLVS